MEKMWLLGKTEDGQRIYLEDFKWDCGWYWGGGYLKWYARGAKAWHSHTHFGSTFGDYTDTHTGYNKHIKHSVLNDEEVWRLCDLMRQFYCYREAAECAQYGGHMTSKGRKKEELNKDLGAAINKQIEIVIREVRILLDGTIGRKINMRKVSK